MSKNGCKCDYCMEGKVHKKKNLRKIAEKEIKDAYDHLSKPLYYNQLESRVDDSKIISISKTFMDQGTKLPLCLFLALLAVWGVIFMSMVFDACLEKGYSTSECLQDMRYEQ